MWQKTQDGVRDSAPALFSLRLELSGQAQGRMWFKSALADCGGGFV